MVSHDPLVPAAGMIDNTFMHQTDEVKLLDSVVASSQVCARRFSSVAAQDMSAQLDTFGRLMS